jgi:predicted PP-loop superfamily ATPase
MGLKGTVGLVVCPRTNHVPLVFRKRTKHLKHHLAGRRRGVEALLMQVSDGFLVRRLHRIGRPIVTVRPIRSIPVVEGHPHPLGAGHGGR